MLTETLRECDATMQMSFLLSKMKVAGKRSRLRIERDDAEDNDDAFPEARLTTVVDRWLHGH